MNVTSIKLLKSLIAGPKRTGELPDLLKVKTSQLSHIVNRLTKDGYVEKKGTTIMLKDTAKTTLLRDVAQTLDIETLLAGPNATVLSNIAEGISADELVTKSGLSRATIYRSISELRSIGAVTKDKNVISINESKGQLPLFVKLLETERAGRYEDDGSAEIVYNKNLVILRKVSRGWAAGGVPTGFTLFSDYDMEYRTDHDYFCEQGRDPDMYDVLLHAILVATLSKNKMALLIAVVFYAKHKDTMDTAKLRKRATKLGLSQIWLDVEAYMCRRHMKNADLFLPWSEFLSKAELYDIPVERYRMPQSDDLLFPEISNRLQEPITVYLFGDENMRIKSLKESTKDCDIVVKDKMDFDRLARALADMGYRRVIKAMYSDEDLRLKPDAVFVHDRQSRVYLFTSTIMQDLSLSTAMRERADIMDFDLLKVGLLRNEDVFLLKAIARRAGDIQDMAALVAGSPDTPGELQYDSFTWQVVWDEILRQGRINSVRESAITIFEQISLLAEQPGIVVPFLDKLRRHVIDMMIKRLLRSGSMHTKEVVEWLEGNDITETRIRNRIAALIASGVAEKHSAGRTTHVRLAKDEEYVGKDLEVNMHRLKTFLDWRFQLRQKPTDLKIEELSEEMRDMGFWTIGRIDNMIKQTRDALERYEHKHFSKRHFDAVGAVRVCAGLYYPNLAQTHRRSSKYFVYL